MRLTDPAPTLVSKQSFDLFDRVYDLVLAREKAEKDNRREKILCVAGGGVVAGACVGHIAHDMATTQDINGPLLWLALFGTGFIFSAIDIISRTRKATRHLYDPGILARMLDDQIYDLTHDHPHYRDGQAWKYDDTPVRHAERRPAPKHAP